MQFLHPAFLWTLAFLLVPILVHLFYFRRYKKVYFSNVRFLKNIVEERSMVRKLKNLLILACRLLALLAFIAAFAQPFFSSKKKNGVTRNQVVGIYVDNSYSMGALQEESDLLNQGLDYAESIIKGYDQDARFALLSNSVLANERRLLSQSQALELCNDLRIVPGQRTADQVFSVFQQILAKRNVGAADLYLISDFQESMMSGRVQADSAISTYLIPLRPMETKNVSIDSVWFESPRPLVGDNQRIYSRFRNYGAEEAIVIPQLELNGRSSSMGQLTIPARAEIIDTSYVNIKDESWQIGSIGIQDFPITYDDKLFLAFEPVSAVQVGVLHSGKENQYLGAAFSVEEFFSKTSMSSSAVDYSLLSKQDLVVLDHLPELSSGLMAELESYILSGGKLCIFPSQNMGEGWSALFSSILGVARPTWVNSSQSVFGFDEASFIFSGLFVSSAGSKELPKVEGFHRLTTNPDHRRLMTMRDGTPFLISRRYGLGEVFFYTSPLDSDINSLPNYPQYLGPVLYKMAVLNYNSAPPAVFLGSEDAISVYHDSGEETLLRLRSGETEVIPYQVREGSSSTIQVSDKALRPGVYDVLEGSETAISKLGLNIGREESDLTYAEEVELNNAFEDARILKSKSEEVLLSEVRSKSDGGSIWRLLVVLGICFLLVEMIISRMWKTN